MVAELIARVEGLEQTVQEQAELIAWFKKQLFGRKAERLVDLAADHPELGLAVEAADEPAVNETPVPAHTRRERKQTERFSIPEDLPVEEVVLDLPEEEKLCPETDEPLTLLREEISDKLAIRPQQFYIKRTIRKLYVSPAAPEAGVIAAPLPEQVIPNCRADVSVLSDVLVKKFADHLPLYRIEQIYDRSGIWIQRQTLSGWVIQLGTALQPLYNLMKAAVFSGDRLFSDSTSLRYIAHDQGSRKGAVWVYCGGPSTGKDPPYLVYDFAVDGRHEHAKRQLANFSGLLHSDAHQAFAETAGREDITWQPCLAHARRKFTDLQNGDLELRKQIIEDFAALFNAERQVWLLPTAEERLAYRQQHSAEIYHRIEQTVTDQLENGSALPKSNLYKALVYIYKRRTHFATFLTDGDAVIDNNLSERTIKPLVIGRKNWLFLGNKSAGPPTAAILSLVQTCRHLDIDPYAYLLDVLTRLPAQPQDRLHELLPDYWANAQS